MAEKNLISCFTDENLITYWSKIDIRYGKVKSKKKKRHLYIYRWVIKPRIFSKAHQEIKIPQVQVSQEDYEPKDS